MITKTFKLTIATDTEEQMKREEEYLSRVYGAEEVEALEQQPCEDCISRADVKKYLSAPDANGDRVIYESDLDLLPPVTPQPKKEHWIDLGDGEYKCPKCRSKFIFGLDIQAFTKAFPNCPRCRAKMDKAEKEE